MVYRSRDIRPVTYLKSHAAEVVRDVSSSDRAVVITQNGEAKAVVIGVEQFEALRKSVALLKLLSFGERDVRAGHLMSGDEVFGRLEELIDEQEALANKAV